MYVAKQLKNMLKIKKRGIDMTKEQKEERKIELLDNLLFGEKMIARGEVTREELQSQFDEIEKDLNLTQLKDGIKVSSSTIAKIKKNEYISTRVIDDICNFLNCEIEDVIEHIKN